VTTNGGKRIILWISALGIVILAAGALALGLLLSEAPTQSTDLRWLEVSLTGDMNGGPTEGEFFLDPENKPLRAVDVVEVLRSAVDDDSISGLLVELDRPTISMALAWEIREELLGFTNSGRECRVGSQHYNNIEFFIASACSTIALHPAGSPAVYGLRLATEHYAGLLEIVGVTPDIERIGIYKSAPEQYQRDQPSEPAMEMLDSLLDDMNNQFISAIAAGRAQDETVVRSWLDAPPVTAEEAVAVGMIDLETDFQDLTSDIGTTIIDQSDYLTEVDRKRNRDERIAILHIQGAIIDGVSTTTLGGSAATGDVTTSEYIESMANDNSIDAVVIRVDSPGGSALASHVIAEAIAALNEVKPVVISMGSYAASGGYYVSAPASVIFSDPTTLTGSIGVFGGKMSLGGLLDRAGITTWESSRAPFATMLDPTRPFSETERELIQRQMQATYDRFLGVVADGRSITNEEVDAVAQGRVWSGLQAKQNGLVDEIGGLEAAISHASSLAGLSNPSRIVLPREGSLWDAIFGGGAGGSFAGIQGGLSDQFISQLTDDLADSLILSSTLYNGGIAAVAPIRIVVE
jgi:protease IV